ncbi:hypothetical protein PoMZ_11403 [Pyricularia oryzae]|uniref:Uncharacterized protein n=1 Tax=Pyricularia oryzae TaxID=318829 RepID=A0A4P7NK93_PYROR|nr:hypothetical protein PoMZ_11403 [Pyricularia oryzae]
MVISASVAKKGRADRESIDLDCRRCQYSLFKTDAELVDMRLREHQLGLTVGWLSRTIGVGKQARCRRRVKAHQFAATGVPGSTQSNMKRTRPTWEIQGGRGRTGRGGPIGEISGLVHTVQVLQGVPLQGCHPELYQEQTGYHVVFALIAWEVPDFAELDS